MWGYEERNADVERLLGEGGDGVPAGVALDKIRPCSSEKAFSISIS